MNTYIATVYDEPYLYDNGICYSNAFRTTEVLFTYEPGEKSANIIRTSVFPVNSPKLQRDEQGRNLAGVINEIILFGLSETEMFINIEANLKCMEIKGKFKLERISLDDPNIDYIIGDREISNSIETTESVSEEDLKLM